MNKTERGPCVGESMNPTLKATSLKVLDPSLISYDFGEDHEGLNYFTNEK
jgi:hypothetical protein